MDPINNPTPTPNPAPGVVPNSGPEPTVGAGPNPVQPTGNVTVNPPAPTAPVQPAGLGTPVQSGGSSNNTINRPAPAQPVAPVPPAPVNPVFKPTGVGVAATDPIMMPEQPKAPDPIEEELKAPMKAAAPAPGSIGSAVSGPAEVLNAQPANPEPIASSFGAPQTPNVSFTDPASQPDVSTNQPAMTQPVKKQSSKKSLIALIIVALMVIVALGAVFALQLVDFGGSGTGSGSGSGSSSSSNSNSNSSSNSTVNPNNNDVKEDYGGGVDDLPNNNSSTNNGSSSSSSDSNSNSSSTNGTTVLCTASYTQTDGKTVNHKNTYVIQNNKLTSVISEKKISDSTGNSTAEKEELDISTISSSLGNTVGTDGALSVTVAEFTKNIEASLNKNEQSINYTCSL